MIRVSVRPAAMSPARDDHPRIDFKTGLKTAQRLMAEQAAKHKFTVSSQPKVFEYDDYARKYFYNVQSSRDVNYSASESFTTLNFNADTGELISLHIPTGEYAGNTVADWPLGPHMVRVFGLTYRIFVSVLGIVIAALSHTGVYIWRRKLKVRRAAARAKLAGAAVLLLLFVTWAATTQSQTTGGMEAVRISFAGRLGGKPFACGQRYVAIGSKPVTVTPADLRFFVSELALLDASGKATPVKLDQDGLWQYQDLALVDMEDGTGGCRNGNSAMHTEITGSVPRGSYTGLHFTVGVPFALDHVDAATAPAPLNFTAMNWVWQAGFKFIRSELLVVQDKPNIGVGPSATSPMKGDRPIDKPELAKGTTPPMRSGGFPVHIGSTACASLAKTAPPTEECKHPNRLSVVLPQFNLASDEVIFDMDRLLAGSDVTSNSPSTAPGCMSGENDPDCAPIFKALGLPFNGSTAGEQTVLYREAKP